MKNKELISDVEFEKYLDSKSGFNFKKIKDNYLGIYFKEGYDFESEIKNHLIKLNEFEQIPTWTAKNILFRKTKLNYRKTIEFKPVDEYLYYFLTRELCSSFAKDRVSYAYGGFWLPNAFQKIENDELDKIWRQNIQNSKKLLRLLEDANDYDNSWFQEWKKYSKFIIAKYFENKNSEEPIYILNYDIANFYDNIDLKLLEKTLLKSIYISEDYDYKYNFYNIIKNLKEEENFIKLNKYFEKDECINFYINKKEVLKLNDKIVSTIVIEFKNKINKTTYFKKYKTTYFKKNRNIKIKEKNIDQEEIISFSLININLLNNSIIIKMIKMIENNNLYKNVNIEILDLCIDNKNYKSEVYNIILKLNKKGDEISKENSFKIQRNTVIINKNKFTKWNLLENTNLENSKNNIKKDKIYEEELEKERKSIYLNLIMIFLEQWNNKANKFENLKSGLPQTNSGESSRILANIYLNIFDKKAKRICDQNNALYSRYADDITILVYDKNKQENISLELNYEISKIGLNFNNKSKFLLFEEFIENKAFLDIIEIHKSDEAGELEKLFNNIYEKWLKNKEIRIDSFLKTIINKYKENNILISNKIAKLIYSLLIKDSYIFYLKWKHIYKVFYLMENFEKELNKILDFIKNKIETQNENGFHYTIYKAFKKIISDGLINTSFVDSIIKINEEIKKKIEFIIL